MTRRHDDVTVEKPPTAGPFPHATHSSHAHPSRHFSPVQAAQRGSPKRLRRRSIHVSVLWRLHRELVREPLQSAALPELQERRPAPSRVLRLHHRSAEPAAQAGRVCGLLRPAQGTRKGAAPLDTAHATPDATAAGAHRVLAAVAGDFQIDPPSPLKCSIAYQRSLNEVQDECSDMDITAFVDETMLQGGTSSLPTDYATKRTVCKDGCDAESLTLKATVYSREASNAELARFGPDIMGSPLHPRGRVLCIKYLGGYIGDGPTCARKTAERLKQATAVLDRP